MTDPFDLRISDQQRDRAAQDIREHYAAGRLSDEEMDERVQAAYQARTEQDLNRLLADLPKLPATRAQQRAEMAERRRHLQRQLIQQSGGGLALFAACTVIWAVGGGLGFFWPVWILVVVVLPLLRNGWRLYGPAPEFDRVEQELASRRARSRHDRRSRRR